MTPPFTTSIKPSVFWSGLRKLRDHELEQEFRYLEGLIDLMRMYQSLQHRIQLGESTQTKPVGEKWPTLKEHDRDYVVKVVKSTRSLGEAAKVLDVNPTTLWRRNNRGVERIRL